MTKLYQKLFKKCPSASEIRKGLKTIYSAIPEVPDRRALMDMLAVIDLTSLNTTDNKSHILQLTGKVNSFNAKYSNIPTVAAICVYPNFVSLVREKLTARNVKIAAVAGGFPSSQTFRSIKLSECRLAVDAGADEIDIVISLGSFLSGDYSAVADEIREIKSNIGDVLLKVIIESGLMQTHEQIFNASMIAMDAGADFIKTSTGKTSISATPEAAYVMCTAISVFFRETGIRVGFKPAGGIVTSTDAAVYTGITKSVLGEEWINPSLFRLGASRLANNILSDIMGCRSEHY
ncbi:MAG TPA: deoxyribose-phosphate aldolase [Bacteroidales bacterium]|nr:deoxyribose-phosphate aldolase [Bacteroidales bacterium]